MSHQLIKSVGQGLPRLAPTVGFPTQLVGSPKLLLRKYTKCQSPRRALVKYDINTSTSKVPRLQDLSLSRAYSSGRLGQSSSSARSLSTRRKASHVLGYRKVSHNDCLAEVKGSEAGSRRPTRLAQVTGRSTHGGTRLQRSRSLCGLHEHHAGDYSARSRTISSGHHSQTRPVVVRARSYSSLSDSQILGRSSILLQDGLDIRELPLVVRRMNATLDSFPFNTVSYRRGDILRPVNDEDRAFNELLQGCGSLEDILRLLEVPGEKVTPVSAAFALQRLCQLRGALGEAGGGGGAVDSFVQKAVFNELCDTATRDLAEARTDTLLALMTCYLNAASIDGHFRERVDAEIERRVGDSALSVLELCTFIQTLARAHPAARGGEQPQQQEESRTALLHNLWIHLGSRFQEIDQESIAEVYDTMSRLRTSQQRYLLPIVDKQLARCWWQLRPEQVRKVAAALQVLSHDNLPALKALGRWVALNGHELHDGKLLRHLLAMYLHFSYGDRHFTRALELCVPARVARLDSGLLAMVMDYCRQRRLCSRKILNAVAADFERHPEAYATQDVVGCLRAYGQLGYTPPNAARLFAVIEAQLLERFKEMEAASMLELLASFSYIGRLPVNFIDKVFSPHFLARLQNTSDSNVKSRSSVYLQQLRSALLLETVCQVGFVNWHVLGKASTLIAGRWHKFHVDVGQTLVRLLRSKSVLRQSETPRHIAYFVDYEILLSRDGHVLEPHERKRPAYKTLAIVTVMAEHCLVDSNQLLGEHIMKMRHLALMGYTVVRVDYDEFTWNCRTPADRDQLLRGLLSEHISFSPSAAARRKGPTTGP